MTDEQRANEIARLERLRAASEGRDGYASRIRAIDKRMAELCQ